MPENKGVSEGEREGLQKEGDVASATGLAWAGHARRGPRCEGNKERPERVRRTAMMTGAPHLARPRRRTRVRPSAERDGLG